MKSFRFLPTEIIDRILLFTDFKTVAIARNEFVLTKLYTYNRLKSTLISASNSNDMNTIIYLWNLFKNKFDSSLFGSLLVGNAHCGNIAITKQIGKYFKEQYLANDEFIWFAFFHAAHEGHKQIVLDLMELFDVEVLSRNEKNICTTIAYAMKYWRVGHESVVNKTRYPAIATMLKYKYNIQTYIHKEYLKYRSLPYDPTAIVMNFVDEFNEEEFSAKGCLEDTNANCISTSGWD